MPTLKTLFWLLAAAILYLIAWNVGSGWLYILVAMLVGFPLASTVISRFNARSLSVTQATDPSAVQGEAIPSRLLVSNSSRLPRFLLRFECHMAGGGYSFLLPFLGGRQVRDFPVVFGDLRRGVYPGGLILLRSGAPAGLATSRRRIHTDSPLVVYPRAYALTGDWGEGRKDTGYMVSTAIPTRHAASDYLGVREYRPQDSPRSIHWRTTARTGRLTVVEYARQAAITPVFLLDTFHAGNTCYSRQDTFESAVGIAASLLQREAAHNRRFAVGESPAQAAENGLDHDPRPAMLWLAQVEAGAGRPIDLAECPALWPEATPVLILASHQAYANLDASELLQAYPNTFVIMLDGRGFGDGADASRFLDDGQLERLADNLEAMGANFMPVSNHDQIVPCLESL